MKKEEKISRIFYERLIEYTMIFNKDVMSNYKGQFFPPIKTGEGGENSKMHSQSYTHMLLGEK